MSYSGTVRCGHCWGKGHNRASCIHLREKMEKLREVNPADWRVMRYFDKKKEKRQRLKNKKCSYCRTAGHTRPTCLELKHAKKVAIEKCTEWRKKLVEGLQRQGIGIGTLVKYHSWGEKNLGMITNIDWEDLDHRIAYGSGSPFSLTVTPFKTRSNIYGRSFRCALPPIEKVYFSAVEPTVQFIGPVTPADVVRSVPAGFFNPSETFIENVFVEKEKHSARTEHWDIADWCKLQGFYEKKQKNA